MSRSDYARPARYQVRTIARCKLCHHEREYDCDQGLDNAQCFCGGTLVAAGVSYPANAHDWDEERDTPSGEWRRKR